MYSKFEEEFCMHLRNDLDDQRRIDVREKMIELVERMHDKVVKFRGSNSRYASIINDLTFSLGLWLDGYEMDTEDPEKLRSLLCTACAMIGKPRTMEELVALLGLDMGGNVVNNEDTV